jgi:peroxiredoxin
VVVPAAGLVLAGVFVVAGVAKFADREASQRSMAAFGAPERAAGVLAWAVAATEVAIAGALLFPPSRVAGAFGALTLLMSLSAIVAVNVARKRSAECHCFGRLSRGPVGWSALARNGLLSSIAGYVAVSGINPVLFGASALACGALWVRLGWSFRRVGRGASAPSFSLPDGAGARWTVDRLLGAEAPVLLVFSQPGCGACQAVFPALRGWQARLDHSLTIVVVNQAPVSQERIGGIRGPTLADDTGSVALAYGVTATPSAVLIDRSGRLAGAVAQGADEIRVLVTTAFEPDPGPRFARRAAISRAVQGAAALGAFPLLTAACGTSKHSSSLPEAIRVGNTYVCGQRYALCTNASCVPSKDDPSVVICDCVVESGYSIGLTTCSRRAPRGRTVYSTFSTRLVTNTTRVMTCPASTPWANCLDAICEVDAHAPQKARCRCPLVNKGPSLTFGGNCNTRTCSSTIWSAASSNLAGSSQLVAEMKRLGQPLAQPGLCPT